MKNSWIRDDHIFRLRAPVAQRIERNFDSVWGRGFNSRQGFAHQEALQLVAQGLLYLSV